MKMKKATKKLKTPKTAITLITASNSSQLNPENNQPPWYLRKYSRYSQIIRLVAWTLRFVNNCRNKEKIRIQTLTAQELQSAEYAVFKMVQSECFDGEKDPRLSDLVVYRDEMGLLRLKTPVAYRDDSMGFRCPVILDRGHLLVNRLIEDCHLELKHGSIDTTLNKLRERVWILSSRRAVQSVVRNCARCKRYTAKRLESISIPLPENRVRDASAFEVSGVDLTSPLFLRDGSKSWIVLFTCAVYRAIHLELVSTLSTDSFLEALRRFIARRGRPAVLYSDNGTNFVGASNALRSLNWETIITQGASTRIDWRFNPPSAAWWGGWWERMVRMVKDLLKRTLGKACLTFEEISTILCDCEAIINARPLTYLAEDTQQLVPLSPDMFLRDLPDYGVPDLDKADSTSLNARVNYHQRLREELRSRFRIEYLGQLKQHGVIKPAVIKIKEGYVVFVGSDNVKRLEWPLARVDQVFPGKDGEIRVVKLKTANGYVTRPIQKLYPLEMSMSEIEEILRASDAEPENWHTVPSASKVRRAGTEKKKKLETKAAEVLPGVEDRKVLTRSGRVVKKPPKLID
ncbi:uncharacterized protein LOC107044225 [Diachasma alloeum]|uniref:uncharacterized protein LOC107044225 n=1 Tax=Diachasma alloeum TaxID=454923 RepID=UPI0007382167|nr:uncharacterized protein LOC107044225 [Diachasma alloeum]